MHEQFPQDPDLIYLNHAGVGPWPARARDAVASFADECVRLGARHYARWLETERRLRGRLARVFNVDDPEDVALVKNTSEGLSFVAYGLSWHSGDEVVVPAEEFPSNRWVWESLEERYGVRVRKVDFTQGPGSPEDALIAAFTPRTRLLSVSTVQYASGLRMDLPTLAQACRDRGVLLCLDAIQSTGVLPLEVEADFIVADGHKWMLGPEGLGGLYVRPELLEELRVWEYGWHMVEEMGQFEREDWTPARSARRLECGSPNLLGAHALDASLSVLEEHGLERIAGDVTAHAEHVFEGARARGFRLMTPTQPGRYAGIVTFEVPGRDPADLAQRLRERGVVCAARHGGIRFSPHFYTGSAQIDEALERVAELARVPAD